MESIKTLGLKKPIQVSRQSTQDQADAYYDLVCGQGRVEAFLALGYKEIPAVVVEVSPYDLDRGRINFRHKDVARPMGSPPTRRQQNFRRR